MKGHFRFPILFLLAGLCTVSFSQTVQTIRGKIADKESKTPLFGAAVYVMKDSAKAGAALTDMDGNFRMENIRAGRYDVQVTMLGYQPLFIPNITVSSGKEVILNFEMEENAVQKKEVEITATKKGETLNEMTTVSARAFSVDETNRYAGSRGDPARMASNFAGVQGADDSRNDIVVRGNSPMGILWRLEGIDIPNPNHFVAAGTTGGPVSILNNKMLANSDFMTGAFPAEYGNSIAGVFDLRMRNGNNEKHEFTGQFGFLGTEMTAEGPISKKNGSSYLVNYRYSTLQLFSSLHIDVGTNAIPRYQDGSFKLNFPLKKGMNLSFFGLGGISAIDIIVSKDTVPAKEIYGDRNRDQYYNTSMGATGMSLTKTVNEKTYVKFVLAYSGSLINAKDLIVYRDSAFKVDSILPKLGFRFIETKMSGHLFVNHKYSPKLSMKLGMTFDHYLFNFVDSNYNEQIYKFQNRCDYHSDANLFQPYVQFRYKFSDKFILNAGVHMQGLTVNPNSFSIEPRAGLKWIFSEKQSLGFGYGIHSQMLPTYIYFLHLASDSVKPYYLLNKMLGFYKSTHYVLSYDNAVSQNLHLRIEAYYQQLSDVPIDIHRNSFSLLNQGTGFDRFFPDTLVNAGTGRNYGIECTLEKYFANSFFFLATLSLFDAKYKGSDGVERNTDFNGTYAANLLAGKEFKIKDNKMLSLGGKITAAGGHRYTPLDLAKSKYGEEVYTDSLRNTLQLKDYFRFDVKINFSINSRKKKITHELGLDLVNVLGTKNVLKLIYDPDPKDPSANPIKEEYQLGFLPLFYYRIDF